MCADLSLALDYATGLKFLVGGSSAGGAEETNSFQCAAETGAKVMVPTKDTKSITLAQNVPFEH